MYEVVSCWCFYYTNSGTILHYNNPTQTQQTQQQQTTTNLTTNPTIQQTQQFNKPTQQRRYGFSATRLANRRCERRILTLSFRSAPRLVPKIPTKPTVQQTTAAIITTTKTQQTTNTTNTARKDEKQTQRNGLGLRMTSDFVVLYPLLSIFCSLV